MRRDIAEELVASAKAMIGGIPDDANIRSLIDRLQASIDKTEESLKKEINQINETKAFVTYGSLGQPLVYVIPVEKELTATQQSKITALFKAKPDDNADTWIQWREVS